MRARAARLDVASSSYSLPWAPVSHTLEPPGSSERFSPEPSANEAWPRDKLGKIGLMAAALITDRVDALPADVAKPAIVWQRLPRELQMIVNERNPAMTRAGSVAKIPDLRHLVF